MTAEQLEELLAECDKRTMEFMPIEVSTVRELTHRVIAAEKLVEALEDVPLGDGPIAQLVTAYREASK